MDKITVLMSTYNGEKYIRQQIESILNQKDVQVTLLVRDDGSTDSTRQILQSYEVAGKLTWFFKENLKSAYSFWDLVERCEINDYYSFADQDDFWYENKLTSAITMLKQHAEPSLYFCKKRLVDKDLKPLDAKDEQVNYVGLGTNLLHCRAAGCTMVFNHALMKLLREYHPAVISMHDSWILRVASACGCVIYDERIFMDYRQHDHNVVGATSVKLVWKKRLATLTHRRQDTLRTTMAKQLYDHYGKHMENRELKEMLNNFKDIRYSWSARMKTFQSAMIQPQDKRDRIFVKLMILLGWL